MNRAYMRSFASLASVIVALAFGANAAIELLVTTKSTIPAIEALKPLESAQTWRFVEPKVKEGADGRFVEERISGLVSEAALLQESWKLFAEDRALRLWWEVAAWSVVLACSLVLFLTRTDSKNAI